LGTTAAGDAAEFVTIWRAVVIADQVGSTPQFDRLGLLPAAEAQFAINRAARALLERHGGTWVKGTGDGFLATFSSLGAALSCARELQRQGTSAPHGQPVAYRVGIATGMIAVGPDDIYGLPIVVAERLRHLAAEREVLVAAGDMCELRGTPSLAVRGPILLKGICEPVLTHAYE